MFSDLKEQISLVDEIEMLQVRRQEYPPNALWTDGLKGLCVATINE